MKTSGIQSEGELSQGNNLLTMKLPLLLLICYGARLAYTYDEKYDRIEIEKIVENDIVHRSVNDCILGDSEADCGPYWDEVRELAVEIAQDHCAKCSARQKTVVGTYVNATKSKYPDTWKKIHDKFKKKL